MKIYGLIGKSLQHSFSPDYFSKKFKEENLKDCYYELYQLNSINDFPEIISKNTQLVGLNVTIPYKQSIIPYIDKLDIHAEKIGAINTIKIERCDNKTVLTGYNTDYLGFIDSIKPLITNFDTKALILGTGGSSVAVSYALNLLGIKNKFVSRNPIKEDSISYSDLNEKIIQSHQIIINTTPLGMFPDIENQPNIPYHLLTSDHLLFDLIYNPTETNFLKRGRLSGAKIKNGIEMLGFQAEYSWKIWND